MRELYLEGTRFGKLVAREAVRGGPKGTLWHCDCDCGRRKTVRQDHLKAGAIKSCGSCFSPRGHLTSGLSTRGASLHPLYGVWSRMIDRCGNARAHNFRWYGAKGIRVCERWAKSFEAFVSDVEPRPPHTTLDRYPDKHGNYEPGNVRWATKTEQGNNARNNIVITYAGKTQTLKQWSRELGLNYLRLYNFVRTKRWTFEQAIYVAGEMSMTDKSSA